MNSEGADLGTAILGGGPAGLGWVLADRGVPATVLEADGTVGGLAKTFEFGDYRFDLGGHRFYTKIGQATTERSRRWSSAPMETRSSTPSTPCFRIPCRS